MWVFEASPEAVFDVLADVEGYPSWWPQVRGVRQVDGESGELRFRSFLPYSLRVVGREVRRDPADGVLELGMRGDLVGFARFTVVGDGGRARALFEQEVEVTVPFMRVFGVVGRPFFRANHAWMMRGGRRGLRQALRERV
ncbi:SRPBCC family protein [Streptomyces smaragdinus]|uniref:SRPBCC family protein n=1 Tax=Streptomyces smaragdinus TaxID=2585196 RepID=UPI002B1F864E|nr:SRPBCC family protein [Streptomyces smaragdinus]